MKRTTIAVTISIVIATMLDFSKGQLPGELKKAKNLIWSNWTDSVKLLKNRIRNIYEKKTLTIHEHVGIGPKPSGVNDFPAFDRRKIRILNETWIEYYACLNAQIKILGVDKMMTPQATSVMAGENVKLECNICVSPDSIGDIIWYFSPAIYKPNFTIVDENENIQISPYEFALNIFNVELQHEGMYICELDNWKNVPYFLHVIDHKHNVTQIRIGSSSEGPIAKKPIKIPDSNLIIWNEWTPWSRCSWCGPVGRRKRIGYCKINLIYNIQENISSTAELYKEDLKLSKGVINISEQLLALFDYGIPCVSNLLTKKLHDHKLLKNYSLEIAVGYCKEPCPGSVLVELVNREGTVIETLNNSAGEYSILQQVPGVTPDPQRLMLYAYTNETLEIACPGNLYTDSPIEWTVKGIVLNAESLESLSNNRITVNAKNHLFFTRAQTVDSRVYSCWQRKELAGVVVLQVSDKFTLDPRVLLEIIKLYAAIPIFAVFIYIVIRIRMDASKSRQVELFLKRENLRPWTRRTEQTEQHAGTNEILIMTDNDSIVTNDSIFFDIENSI